MVVGTILGAAIFVQPSEISRLVPSTAGMLATWLLAGLLTLCGALVCAELAAAFPQTGGVYVFLRETFGPAAGFLWGWAMFWSVHSGIIAALAVVLARYAGYFTSLGDTATRLVAIAAILLLSAVNYLGVRPGTTLQALLTLAKVVAVAVILLLFFWLAPPAAPTAPTEMPSLRDFGLAILAGLFAFGGWHMVTYAAGETREPQRTIPRALLLGTLVVTACYVGLNYAYLRALPLEKLVASERVAADAATALLGPGAAGVISLLVIVSAFSALSGIVLAGPRVYFAMARDGLLFGCLGAVHPRFRTPHRAILLQAVWASLLVLTGTYRELFTRVIYTEWLFFSLMAAGLVWLRRRREYAPGYRAPGYPLVPLLFAGVSLAIVTNQLAAEPRSSALGLLLLAAGLPVYLLWTRPRVRPGAL